MLNTLKHLSTERGFTLIELVVSMAIIAVLSAISITSFWMYQDNAEFTKAESTMRNAQLALEVGVDVMEDHHVIGGISGAAGEPLAGDLAEALPGMIVPGDVLLAVNRMDCGGGQRFMDTITVWACKAGLAASFIRTCNGFEHHTPRIYLGRDICRNIVG